MKTSFRRIFPPFFIILTFIQCSSLQVPEKPKEIQKGDLSYAKKRAEYIVQRAMEKNSVYGGLLLVAKGNEIIIKKGYGISDKSKNIPVSEKTLFQIGSISKVFTALGIMKLKEEGRLSLNDPVTKYIPELKMKKRNPEDRIPTVRNLLTHHSGLPSDIMNGFLTDQKTEEHTEKFRSLGKILENEHMANQPEKTHSYSNLAFGLLGLVIERAAGKSLDSYMREKIFLPIGMKSTSYVFLPNESYSKAYFGKEERDMLKIRDLGAGSVSTNLDDFSNFLLFINSEGRAGNGEVLKKSSFLEMTEPQNKNIVFDFGQSTGLPFIFSVPFNDKIIIGHDGYLPPFVSSFLFSPKEKIAVFTSYNTALSSPSEGTPEIMEEFLEAVSGEKKKPNDNDKIITIEKQTLQKFDGKYAAIPGSFEFTADEGGYRTDKMLYLYPKSDGTFGIKVRILGINLSVEALKKLNVQFAEHSGEKVFSMNYGNFSVMKGVQYTPKKLTDVWKKRKGKYEIINHSSYKVFQNPEISLNEDDGMIVFSTQLDIGAKGAFQISFLPETDTTARTPGLGRYAGEVMYITEENGKEILNYDGYKFRKK
ncbi:MAG TPA: serine hydrolase domain-containing protein [Leptospiraceae bacterium]|nr:serine hydrolase domain-containing protein [Leptospiraceae bacterium]HMY66038.1 serine hydrolase domain-containing protein [Leptospiraceae bacterium]